MLIPAVLPGGVKTKIIVAAMNGTLALAHPSAVDGMDLRDGCEVMLWSTADELAALIHRLRCDDIDLAALASAARAWAEKRHSPAALRAIWRQLVSDALTCHWRDS
jgi:hypothetical protein